tara:strand:+ start:6967 stop:7563 length:597 start_codon:yes stop_codon:yes gene_type:complete
MNPETLLGLISGGRYQTSSDLPTLPEMAHSYIDQIKETHDQQQQREMQIQGQGLGLLDMVGGLSKAGAMIPAGSKNFMNIIKNLKSSTAFSPSTREAAISYARKMRGTSSTKYKDAPTRELMDMALKLDDLAIKSPKGRALEEARYTVDKNLLEAMEEIQRTGMSGTIKPGTEANIKNTFRTLMELIRGRGGIEIPIR